MEIRFSKSLDMPLWTAVEHAARLAGGVAAFTSANGYGFRFTLVSQRGAPLMPHLVDAVIATLFELDPDATIRTARAVYEGLADFEAQFAARNQR